MEVCDPEQLDENCDGAKNEGCDCTAGDTQPCGKDQGVCKPGTQTCVDGSWSQECERAVDPKTPEACDEAENDEDCDGEKNEGCDCIDGAMEDCPGMAVGICKPGQHRCDSGKWSACTGVVSAQNEICDGIDNDCDGQRDNAPSDCASNEQCRNGHCVCVPRRGCDDRECGADDCGTACGTCPTTRPGSEASDGKCFTGGCSTSGTCEATTPIRCFVDSDGDGFPARDGTRDVCAAQCPAGFLAANQSKPADCDDRDDTSYPGNIIYYHDTVDHNCSGALENEQAQVNIGCEPCGAAGACVQASRPPLESDCGTFTRVCETTNVCSTASACTTRAQGYPLRCH